jgi:predicted XRE-type DNA-binding protein
MGRHGNDVQVYVVSPAKIRSATAESSEITKAPAEQRESVTRGTGNVLADLGFSGAAERQAKLRLAYALNQVLDARMLSQADAAKVLGVTQPEVSALRRDKLAGFSLERLMNLLTALDQDVEDEPNERRVEEWVLDAYRRRWAL